MQVQFGLMALLYQLFNVGPKQTIKMCRFNYILVVT